MIEKNWGKTDPVVAIFYFGQKHIFYFWGPLQGPHRFLDPKGYQKLCGLYLGQLNQYYGHLSIEKMKKTLFS